MQEKNENGLTSLCCLNTNQEATICQYNDDHLAQKLMSMGLLPGRKVALVRKIWNEGNYYLKCKDQRLVIGHKEAQAIMVSI